MELDLGNPGTTNADGTPRTARSFITWNTAAFKDALVMNADLSLWNFHSANVNCTAQKWTIWDTAASSTSSRWTDQPTWQQQYHSSTETKGNPACGSDGWIHADVTTLVQYWASAEDGRGHMGLRAATDAVSAWKRVNSADATSNPPKLTVTWNYRPQDGTAQQAGPPFESYGGVWGVNTLTPTLRDKFKDADGDKISGSFQVYDAETNQPIVTPAGNGVLVSDFVEPGEWATVKVPDGQLVDGKTYKFRTNAYDGTHYNLNWSPWREFVVETAAAGTPTSLQPGDTYTINDPDLIANPDKVEEVLTRDGDLEALGVQPRNGPSAVEPAKTMAAWERTYTTSSKKFPRGRKPADPYDYIADVEECTNADDSDNREGYLKNRFAYCQETLTVMPAIECGLWPPGCYLQGMYIATNTLIGEGKIGGHDSSKYARYADFDLYVDVFLVTGDFKKPGAKLKATLECEGNWDPGAPSEADEEEACAPGLYDGRSDSPAQWKYDGHVKLDLWSVAPFQPSIERGEQIATGLFTPTFKFTIPGYAQLISAEGEEGKLRFDSAAYNSRAKLGSVFPDATPALRYRKSDTSDPDAPGEPYLGVAAAAKHIDEARKDPGNTLPSKADKTLPGASPLHPLHRLIKTDGTPSGARVKANRSVVDALCDSGQVPGGPGQGLDCDEYPMASTAEGAARYQYEGDQYKGDFSVRYISPTENQEAGRRLGAWYANDRILNWDPFVITIGD